MSETQTIAGMPDRYARVDTVLRRWPGVIRLFLDRRIMCTGCPVGHIHTLEEACAAHGVALAPLLADIAALITGRRVRQRHRLRPPRSGRARAGR